MIGVSPIPRVQSANSNLCCRSFENPPFRIGRFEYRENVAKCQGIRKIEISRQFIRSASREVSEEWRSRFGARAAAAPGFIGKRNITQGKDVWTLMYADKR
jgi:hypothetical protein